MSCLDGENSMANWQFGFRMIGVRVIAFVVIASATQGLAEEAAPKEAAKEGVAQQAFGAIFRAIVPKVNIAPPRIEAVAVEAVDLVDEPAQIAPDSDVPFKDVASNQDENELKKLEAEVKAKPGGKQTLKRYQPKFEAVAREEFRFMHEVCDLRRSQFDAIKPSVNRITLRVALEATKMDVAMNQGGWRGQPPQPPPVYKMLEDALMEAAKQFLTESQATSYCEEIEARQLFRKEAEAGLLLGYIDRELHLTDEQRTKLIPCLVKAWTPNWEQHLQIVEGNGLQYLPQLPKHEFRKVLDEKQNAVFKSATRVNHSFFMGMQMHQFPEGDQNAKPLEEELVFAPEVGEETQ